MSAVLEDYIGVLKQNCCFYLGDFLVAFVYWIQSVSVHFANYANSDIFNWETGRNCQDS